VQRNSHRNHITNNDITGDLVRSGAVRVPGPTGASNLVFTAGGAAVLIAQVNGPEPLLFNAVVPLLFNGVIKNTLYQLNATNSLAPNEEFTGDNLVEGNSITFLGGNQGKNDGIALTPPQRTKVRNNTIEGAKRGIRAGIQSRRENSQEPVLATQVAFASPMTIATFPVLTSAAKGPARTRRSASRPLVLE
jgi:hypothetical protein